MVVILSNILWVKLKSTHVEICLNPFWTWVRLPPSPLYFYKLVMLEANPTKRSFVIGFERILVRVKWAKNYRLEVCESIKLSAGLMSKLLNKKFIIILANGTRPCETVIVNNNFAFAKFIVRESFAIRYVSETFEWRYRQRSNGLAHVSVTSRLRRTAFNER